MFVQSTNLSLDLPYSFSIKKQFTSELQWHSDFSLFFILKGEINVNIDERGHLLTENDLYFFEPLHTFTVLAASADIQVLHLVIQSNFIKTLVPDYDHIHFITHYLRSNTDSKPYLTIAKNLGRIIFHSIKAGTSEHLKCVGYASDLLSTLIENYGEIDNHEDHANDYAKERIREIITYVNSNYQNKIMIDDISDHLGIHPQYFSSFFKKHFKKTFVEFLNHYRIIRSTQQLLSTDANILTIALDNGFSSHKPYSSLFKKVFGVTPTVYRSEHKTSEDHRPLAASKDEGIFYFFQQYWNEESQESTHTGKIQRHLSLNFDLISGNVQPFHNDHPLFIDVGRAASCLRGEIQEIIRTTKGDLDFDYLRFRDIFSDDLFVYHEEEDKSPQFNWHYIDIILDFLTSIHLKPFFEIGFMPRDLASKKQFAGWNFHPNISPPKSHDKWALLVSSFLRHCIGRYGHKEVLSWYFDFWICPDLPITDGYWNESMEEFFEFYLVTYKAVHSVHEHIRLGTPNFSTLYGMDWYDTFFKYCRLKDLKPSYVSIIIYGTETIPNDQKFISPSNTSEMTILLPEKNYIAKQIDVLQKMMEDNQLGDLKIIISNWNISFTPIDLTRDTSFMGPYYAYIQSITLKKTYGMCFRSLSDVNEDFYPPSTLFHGGTGMVDFFGLKKSVYYAAYFCSRLGRRIIDSSDYYILAQSERGYQILLFNLSTFDALYSRSDLSALSYKQRYNIYESGEIMNIHMLLTIESGHYSIKKSHINRNCGSAYDTWLNMGAPEVLDTSLVSYINNKSTPEINFYTEEVSSSLIIDTLVDTHEVILYEIERNL